MAGQVVRERSVRFLLSLTVRYRDIVKRYGVDIEVTVTMSRTVQIIQELNANRMSRWADIGRDVKILPAMPILRGDRLHRTNRLAVHHQLELGIAQIRIFGSRYVDHRVCGRCCRC